MPYAPGAKVIWHENETTHHNAIVRNAYTDHFTIEIRNGYGLFYAEALEEELSALA